MELHFELQQREIIPCGRFQARLLAKSAKDPLFSSSISDGRHSPLQTLSDSHILTSQSLCEQRNSAAASRLRNDRPTKTIYVQYIPWPANLQLHNGLIQVGSAFGHDLQLSSCSGTMWWLFYLFLSLALASLNQSEGERSYDQLTIRSSINII